MLRNKELGIRAEKLAETYYTEKGHMILFRNWRHSRYEIDLITEKAGIIHFVEVKGRRKTDIDPEVNVTMKKFHSLQKAARGFLGKHPEHNQVQFDILSVILKKDGEPEYFLIEDVYL